MKKIKILIIFSLLFLLTGCKGHYDLKINNDLTVEESLYLKIENPDYEKTSNIFIENKINKDNYTILKSSNYVTVKYKEVYKSLNEYLLNSKIYHQLIDEIQYTKTNKFIDLYVDEKLKLNTSNENIGNINNIESLDINIFLPFKVINSNADKIDGKKYIWNINNNIVNKKLFIQFNPNKSNKINSQIIVGIVILFCSVVLGIFIINIHKEKNRI